MKQCVEHAFPRHCVFVEQAAPADGGVGFVCRIYRQLAPIATLSAAATRSARHSHAPLLVSMRREDAVELGYGRGLSKAQALHIASLAVLESHFSAELQSAIEANHDFTMFDE